MMSTTKIKNDVLPIVYKIIADTEYNLSMILGSKINLAIKANEGVLNVDDARAMSLQMLVCSEFEITWENIIGRNRCWPIAMARHAYCYLAYHLLGKSLKSIGRELGNRDHTTVLNAKRTIQDLMDVHDEVEMKINHIKNKFYESFNKV